jgi:hypothetical protein
LFDGTVGAAYTGTFFKTDFKTLLYWSDGRQSGTGVSGGLRKTILDFVPSQSKPELADIVIVRRHEDIDERTMPPPSAAAHAVAGLTRLVNWAECAGLTPDPP